MRWLPARWTLFALLMMVVWAAGSPVAVAQEAGGLESGGLGLTRAEWESFYGAGTPVDLVIPIYTQLYEYPFQHGTMYVAFAGSKSELDSVVLYLEIAFAGDGTPSEDARGLVETLIPSDAQIVDPFFAPPTPGAPSALSSFRYESAALASVPYGTESLSSSFLVIYVERYEETRTQGQGDASVTFDALVTRVSIVAAIPIG